MLNQVVTHYGTQSQTVSTERPTVFSAGVVDDAVIWDDNVTWIDNNSTVQVFSRRLI